MEVKKILLEAAELMRRDVTTYMCHAVSIALGDIDSYIPEEIRKAGFTYNNYEKFICKNYLHLEKYLLVQNDYNNAWIIMPQGDGMIFRILESKVAFLKYLANGQ